VKQSAVLRIVSEPLEASTGLQDSRLPLLPGYLFSFDAVNGYLTSQPFTGSPFRSFVWSTGPSFPSRQVSTLLAIVWLGWLVCSHRHTQMSCHPPYICYSFWQENHGIRHSLYSVKSTGPATRTDLLSCQADVCGWESGRRGRRLVSGWLPHTELHSPFSRHPRAHEHGDSRAALVHEN